MPQASIPGAAGATREGSAIPCAWKSLVHSYWRRAALPEFAHASVVLGCVNPPKAFLRSHPVSLDAAILAKELRKHIEAEIERRPLLDERQHFRIHDVHA